MKCPYCENIKNKVFESENTVAFLKGEPATPGHIVLIPKEHYTILDELPDEIAAELFQNANILSSILFEVLGAQGTNTIIHNGMPAGQEVAHVSLNIIPRKENDGLQLQWQPREIDENEMGVAEIQLSKAGKNIIIGNNKQEKAIEVKETTESVKESGWIEKIITRLP